MGAGGERGSRIVAHMGGLGDTGEELWGSNTGLAVAAGTVSVPYSGLGRPSLGRYSHDRAYALAFKANFATARRKLPSFGLWVSSGGLCLDDVQLCIEGVASWQGLQLKLHTLGGEQASGRVGLLEVFNPQFIVSSISLPALLGNRPGHSSS